MIIDKFIEIAVNHPEKTAFSFIHNKKIIKKTFSELYRDVRKMCHSFKEAKFDTPAIVFSPISYDFYVTLLACIYLNKKVVVVNSFRDKERLESQIKMSEAKFIFVNRTTEKLIGLFPAFRNLTPIRTDNYNKFQDTPIAPTRNSEEKILFTFTSGGNGTPKIISRSIDDLERQFALVSQNIPTGDMVAFSTLPIYVLANIISAIPTHIIEGKVTKGKVAHEAKYLARAGVNAIEGSVTTFLAFKKASPFIRKCYMGGSTLRRGDAKRMRSLFPNAEFTYVFGASEAVLISKTTLSEYIESLRFGKIYAGSIVDGTRVEINNPNSYGIGELRVSGECVLNSEHTHLTGDIASVKDGKIYLYGRKNTCDLKSGIYSYVVENRLTDKLPKVKGAAFFVYNGENYLLFEGKEHLKNVKALVGINNVFRVHKLPRDDRHNYKYDYTKCIKIIEKMRFVH